MSTDESKNKQYTNYQMIDVVNGELHLKTHTFAKYDVVCNNVFKQSDADSIRTVLDAGCSLGGIGLKIATLNGIYNVMLNNVTISELDTAKEIANLCNITNVEFSSDNILNLNTNYDLTLYFALIHHLLRTKDITDILQIINDQTNLYTVIEIPLRGDASLHNIVEVSNIDNPWSTKYKPLLYVVCVLISLQKS